MKNPLFRFNNVEFTVTMPNLNFKALENESLSEALNEALSDNEFLRKIF